MATMYAFQVLIQVKGWYALALWIKLLGPLGSAALNVWKDQAKE